MLDVEWLSAEERLRRIGSILCQAACRMQTETRVKAKGTSAKATPTQQRILAVVRGLESAAPEQILSAVQMSRASLARHLRVLREQGLVVRTGLTRQTRYSLPAKQRNVIRSEHDSSFRTPAPPAPLAIEAANTAPARTSEALDLDLG